MLVGVAGTAGDLAEALAGTAGVLLPQAVVSAQDKGRQPDRKNGEQDKEAAGSECESTPPVGLASHHRQLDQETEHGRRLKSTVVKQENADQANEEDRRPQEDAVVSRKQHVEIVPGQH